MSGIAHLGIGFALKWADPKVKVIQLLVAVEACDLILIPLIPFKLSVQTNMILTHSLIMSVLWSAIAIFLALLLRQKLKTACVYGFAVFSHWILDFITHPMGAVFGGIPLPNDMPLFFKGSPLVGLGLYNYSYILAVTFDIGLTIVGIISYIFFKIKDNNKDHNYQKKIVNEVS